MNYQINIKQIQYIFKVLPPVQFSELFFKIVTKISNKIRVRKISFTISS